MRYLFVVFILLTVTIESFGQYFGRNKPRYRSFDFEIKETEHYDIYYYLENPEIVDRLGQWSEMWYDHHRAVFNEDINFKNPILFYNSHADFQQNNAISGAISPGTGGVTEAFKNRVVMPLTFTHQQTNHVLGHELVHAFQFNNVVRGDSSSLRNLANLPLWLSEGLAEYLSLGSKDSHTAMWMRDAVANDDIPTLKDLNGYKYFPYRYGHAVWAYVTGQYADASVKPLYQGTARRGLEFTLDSLLNTNSIDLGNRWAEAMKSYYGPMIEARDTKPQGKTIVDRDAQGQINVSPVISPNGKYFVFLSNADLISTDLFLAEARDGKVVKKLVSVSKGGADHIDYLESSGSWSPDSKAYAYVIFNRGKNALVIVDVESGKSGRPIYIEEAPALTHPSWSPDGKSIVFTGKKEGQVDLFRYNIRSKRTEKLTDDIYSEIAAKHSPDGSTLVFGYDKRSFSGDTYDGMYTMDVAEMDLSDNSITILDIFHGADNISAQYNYEGDILFVSDRDGFKDMYKYTKSTKDITRLTRLKTGVSGITRYSPCISAARKKDRIVCSVYNNRQYTIVKTSEDKLYTDSISTLEVNKVASILPAKNNSSITIVDDNLSQQGSYAYADPSTFKDKDYKPQFKLDYIGGGAGVGVGNNNFTSNASLQGGIQTLFSDILGNNQLFANVAVNGELLDFGSQFTYINRKNRLAYGLGLGHVPARTGYQDFEQRTIDIDNQPTDVIIRNTNILRLFNESLSGFVHLPFSTTLRAEAGMTGFFQHFRQDRTEEVFTFDALGQSRLLAQDRFRVDLPDQIQFNEFYTLTRGWGGSANVALVGDNSYFGMTGPIYGHRFRLSLEQQIGIDNYFATLVDGRKYFYLRPFTLATRFLNYNRFEKETNSVYPIFVGSFGFVRGFQDINLDSSINPEINIDRMIGGKVGLFSAEIRLPFFGPKELALINVGFMMSDLVLFFDSGVAFDEFNQLSDGRLTNVVVTDENGSIVRDASGAPITEDKFIKPLIATSAGVSMRINLSNILIIEPYYARQLVDGGRWDFGLNFIPGW